MTMTRDPHTRPAPAHARPAAPPAEGGAAGPGRALGWLLVVTGAAGVLASWVITLDKFRLLQDPTSRPGAASTPSCRAAAS